MRLDKKFFSSVIIFSVITFISFYIHFSNPGEELNFSGFDVRKVYYFHGTKCFQAIYNSKERGLKYIVLSRIYSQGLTLVVNEKGYFKVGGNDAVTNLWSTSVVVPVELKKGKNVVKLCLDTRNKAEALMPIVVTDNPWFYSAIIKLFFSEIVIITIIYMFFTFLLFLIASKRIVTYKKLFLYLSISALFAMLFTSYFMFDLNLSTSNHVAVLERLELLFLLWGMFFYILSLYEITEKKLGKVCSTILYIHVLAGTFFIILPKYGYTNDIAQTILISMSIWFIRPLVRLYKYKLFNLFYPQLAILLGIVAFAISIPLEIYNYSPAVFAILYLFGVYTKEFFLLYRDFERSVRYDHLTGSYNRIVLSENIAKKGDVVAFIDINNFKKFNDTMGHKKGDKVLRDVVRVIKTNIKGYDRVIRYGGDEFVIILRGCSLKDAKEILHKISEEYKKLYPSGLSYGIAMVEGDIKEAIKKADAKMYDMKKEKD